MAGGCSQPQAEAGGEGGATKPAEVPAAKVLPAELVFSDQPQVLAMETEGQRVLVGDPMDRVSRLFPKPVRAFPISDLPEGLSPEFETRGWEMAATSIGMIGARGRLALLLEIQDRVDEESIQERVASAAAAGGPPSAAVEVGPVRYWFWESTGARKMLCASPDERGRLSLTTALGHPKLMTALRMNKELAEQDASAAVGILAESQKADPKPSPPAAVDSPAPEPSGEPNGAPPASL